jgi:hypothetical protein
MMTGIDVIIAATIAVIPDATTIVNDRNDRCDDHRSDRRDD